MTTPARARRTARIGALSAGLALALTGCFGKAEPSPSTTAAPAPSSGGSSSTTTAAASDASSGAYVPASEKGPARNVPKPVMPEAMKTNDQAGAEAAVRYFWEALYYMQQTGDPTDLNEISEEQCIFCSYSRTSMKNHYDGHGWFTGQRPHITSLMTRPSSVGYISTAVIDFDPATAYLRDGSIAPDGTIEAESDQTWVLESRYDNSKGHWTVFSAEYKPDMSK